MSSCSVCSYLSDVLCVTEVETGAEAAVGRRWLSDVEDTRVSVTLAGRHKHKVSQYTYTNFMDIW